MVGLGEVFQQTPLAVTADPLSDVIFPPLWAEFIVILPGVVVVNIC